MHYEFKGLTFGGAYFRNFTVFNSFIPSKHSKAFPRQFQFLINRPLYLNSLIIYVLILSMFFFLPRTFPLPVIIQCMTETVYRAFSLTWPASMQIHWNKRNCLHKKIVQLPLGTPT